jgi:sRNA-binding carbon storage regulator CsrA
MLVFRREPQQQTVITIPPSTVETVVVITNVGNHPMRQGVEAPRCVAVHRAEVQQRIDAQVEEICRSIE